MRRLPRLKSGVKNIKTPGFNLGKTRNRDNIKLITVKKIFILIFLLSAIKTMAQTGIGTTSPDASAKLEVNSSNKGFLPPRVTLTSQTDNTTIANPATGLLVYNTGNNPNLVAGYYYWNGGNWATIATATGSGVYSSYLRGSRSTAQTTGLASGSTVIFSQVDNQAGQDISLNTSTGQITLAAGRTYRLIAQSPNFQTTSGETRLQLGWYNESTSSYIGSSSSAYPPTSGAAYGATGGLAEAIITTTTSTVVSFRILQQSNMSQLGGSADYLTTGSYPWFEIQVISGNQAIEPDKVSKFVDAGATVSLDNLKVAVTTTGSRGLCAGTVTGTMNLYVQGIYTNQAGTANTDRTTTPVTYTTTLSTSMFGWSFGSVGDTVIYHFTDLTNSRTYRVTMIIMPSYLKNFISIERLST
jgi:hypothetical protein